MNQVICFIVGYYYQERKLTRLFMFKNKLMIKKNSFNIFDSTNIISSCLKKKLFILRMVNIQIVVKQDSEC